MMRVKPRILHGGQEHLRRVPRRNEVLDSSRYLLRGRPDIHSLVMSRLLWCIAIYLGWLTYVKYISYAGETMLYLAPLSFL
jgi:hypothetical protein